MANNSDAHIQYTVHTHNGYVYLDFVCNLQNIVMSMSVSDRLSILLFMHVDCVHGSVLLWQHCDVLCISGFVDYVMSLHNRREDSVSIPTKFCSEIKTKYLP